MSHITDPNTGILIPVPSSEPGPLYATEISAALTKLSSLTHTGASNLDGIQIPTAGINVDADLTLNGFNLINSRSVRLADQGTVISGSGDVNSVYVDSGNLYFNNGSGTPVPITSGAAVAVAATNNYNSLSITVNTVINATDLPIVYNVHSSSAITITLPIAADVSPGRFYIVKDATGNSETYNIRVNAVGSDHMDAGTHTFIYHNYGSMMFISDGISNWFMYKFDQTSYDSGESLTFASGSQLSLQAGSITGLSGTTSVTSTGVFGISSGGSMRIHSGATETVDSGGTLSLASGSSLTIAGATVALNGTNSTLTSTSTSVVGGSIGLSSSASITAGNTSSIDIASGGSLVANSGSNVLINTGCNFEIGNFPVFISNKTRTISESILTGMSPSGVWFGYTGIPAALQSGAVGGVWNHELIKLHNGARLISVTMTFIVGASHSGVPANLPYMQITRTPITNPISGAVQLSTTTFQYPIAPGSGSVWYNSGTPQTFVYVCNQNNVIDNSQYLYTLTLADESGTNSIAGNLYVGVAMSFDTITSSSWSI